MKNKIVAFFLLSCIGFNSFAQEPNPIPLENAYPGCRLIWDYPQSEESLIGGFGVFNGTTRVEAINDPKTRTIDCAKLQLVKGENLIKVRAWGLQGQHSEFAQLRVNFQDIPTISIPTNIRVIFEFEPTP